jgi:hypothetical protein
MSAIVINLCSSSINFLNFKLLSLTALQQQHICRTTLTMVHTQIHLLRSELKFEMATYVHIYKLKLITGFSTRVHGSRTHISMLPLTEHMSSTLGA